MPTQDSYTNPTISCTLFELQSHDQNVRTEIKHTNIIKTFLVSLTELDNFKIALSCKSPGFNPGADNPRVTFLIIGQEGEIIKELCNLMYRNTYAIGTNVTITQPYSEICYVNALIILNLTIPSVVNLNNQF